jgi:hypothetical protein
MKAQTEIFDASCQRIRLFLQLRIQLIPESSITTKQTSATRNTSHTVLDTMRRYELTFEFKYMAIDSKALRFEKAYVTS